MASNNNIVLIGYISQQSPMVCEEGKTDTLELQLRVSVPGQDDALITCKFYDRQAGILECYGKPEVTLLSVSGELRLTDDGKPWVRACAFEFLGKQAARHDQG